MKYPNRYAYVNTKNGGTTLTIELKAILEMAISFEKESYTFYNGLKERIKNRALSGILDELATSEIAHRTKLEHLLSNYEEQGEKMLGTLEPRDVEDLKLSEFMLPMKLDGDSSFQDVLIAAMQREGRANEFYVKMLRLAKSEESRNLFEFLAQEEMEHKNIIEKIYDDEIYTEF